MNYKEIDNIHIIKTNKFKTVTIKIIFSSLIKKEEITLRNVLCDILLQSTKNYNSKRKLSIKAQDLYAAQISTNTLRNGKYITSSFTLNILNDKYTEDNNMNKSIEFLKEIIFNPDINNKEFNNSRLEIVKNNIRNNINSIKENPSIYSLIRLGEVSSTNECSYRMCGYIEDLDKINTNNLYDYYLDFINNSKVDIYIVGDVDDSISNIILNNFKVNNKDIDCSYYLDRVDCKDKVLERCESTNNSQSKLAISCNIEELNKFERDYVLSIYNLILGGGVDSKFFKYIREKYSLCYTIRSIPSVLNNQLIITAGIDNKNYSKTIELINKYMDEVKLGKFSDKDIKVAIEYMLTGLDDVYEDSNSIINYYYSMKILELDDIEKRKILFNKVDKDSIIKVANKIKLDTIFNLEGVDSNGD